MVQSATERTGCEIPQRVDVVIVANRPVHRQPEAKANGNSRQAVQKEHVKQYAMSVYVERKRWERLLFPSPLGRGRLLSVRMVGGNVRDSCALLTLSLSRSVSPHIPLAACLLGTQQLCVANLVNGCELYVDEVKASVTAHLWFLDLVRIVLHHLKAATGWRFILLCRIYAICETCFTAAS